MLRRCAQLCVLDLAGSAVSDHTILAVCNHCPQLTAIDVSWCGNLTDVSIIALVTHCKHLHTLWLDHNINHSDAALYAVAAHGQQLHSLKLNYGPNFTLNAVLTVLTRCIQLRVYSFSAHDKGADWNLAIAHHIPPSIRLIYSVTDEILMALSKRFSLLEHLDVGGVSDGYTESSAAALVHNCPRLTTVVVPVSMRVAVGPYWQTARRIVRVISGRDCSSRHVVLLPPSFEL